MKSPVLLLLFDIALAALGALMASEGRSVPAISIFAALGLLGAWQIVLFASTPNAAARFRVESLYRSTHYVQGFLQALFYGYLALYWDGIITYAPLILAQAAVGYLCDILLAWSRGRPAKVGFGIVPVILSTNLFLWFKEDYFYCQLLMIVLAFFSKEFLTWNYGGRRRHIFNPSAFPLSVVSVLLLLSGETYMTRGADLVGAFEVPPNFYEVIFLLGLVTQTLFLTTAVSMGATLALFLLHLVAQLVYGEPLSATSVQIQVFLGLTFLVTDPATSPKSSLGRFLFGLAYGAGVFATYVGLRLAHQPAYFDKLLVVPVVNLLVPLFDRFTDWIERLAIPSAVLRSPVFVTRFGWLVAYVALFVCIIPTLKVEKTRPYAILPPPVTRYSEDIGRLLSHHRICRVVFPEAFKPFGLWAEFSNLPAIRKIYQEGLAGVPKDSPLYEGQ
jgi:Na+-translocating ferredoxin:NAD+ oxidoreductase RnfD subunit